MRGTGEVREAVGNDYYHLAGGEEDRAAILRWFRRENNELGTTRQLPPSPTKSAQSSDALSSRCARSLPCCCLGSVLAPAIGPVPPPPPAARLVPAVDGRLCLTSTLLLPPKPIPPAPPPPPCCSSPSGCLIIRSGEGGGRPPGWPPPRTSGAQGEPATTSSSWIIPAAPPPETRGRIRP